MSTHVVLLVLAAIVTGYICVWVGYTFSKEVTNHER
jgi:hypothetical protein